MEMVEKFFTICVLAAVAPLTLSVTKKFTMPPPDEWPYHFQKCSGKAQSPIDIITADVSHNHKLYDFALSDNYALPLEGAEIKNNGYTVQISPGTNDEPRRIDKGSLDGVYQFEFLAFRWESEHTIDDRRFPLEMQLVHKNTAYSTIEEATRAKDGFAQLAVLFELDDEDNPALEPIIDKLADVREEGSSAKLGDNLSLFSLLPRNSMPYYRYEGSITVPPCFESVKWTVFKELVPISQRQLQSFKILQKDNLVESEPIESNYRPIQNLNDRVVQESGDIGPDTTDHTGQEIDGGTLDRQDEGPETGAISLNLQFQLSLGGAGTSGKPVTCTCS